MSSDELLSKTIDYLRFPLIVGVVFIHNRMGSFTIQGEEINYGEQWPWISYVIYFFSNVLTRVSVPLFFFISGFLFFYKVDFNKDVYKRKIRKRCKTLLVPYLIWNFIGFLILLVQMHPRFASFFPLLQNYRIDITEFLSYFYGKDLPMDPPGDSAAPIDYPLWFVRDLLLLVLASPLIYWGIKKFKLIFIICLGFIWLFGLVDYVGLPYESNKSIFFFPLGAYFSINGLNFVELGKLMWWSPILFSLLAICDMLSFMGIIPSVNCFLGPISVIVGMTAFVYIASFLKWQGDTCKFLSNASFFVFAAHGLIISKYMKAIIMAVQPQSSFVVLFIYFFVPISTILLCLGLFKILEKRAPAVANLLTGGR